VDVTINMNIFSIVTAIGICIAVFISLIILLRPTPLKIRLFLSGLILSTGLSILYEVLYPTGLYRLNPHLSRVYIPPQFLIGPFLYLYTGSITSPQTQFDRRKLLHFLPFFVAILALLPFFLRSAEWKTAYGTQYLNSGRGNSVTEWVVWLYLQVSLLIYSLASVRIIDRYRRKLLENTSNFNRTVLFWLYLMTGGAFALLLSFIVIDIQMLQGALLIQFNTLISMHLVSVIFFFGCIGISRLEYITGYDYRHEKPPSVVGRKPDYELSRIFDEIKNVVIEKKLFLDPDLTLLDLANLLNISRTSLSSIINTGGQVSFYDFINHLRVDELKEKLSTEKLSSRNILDLALDCGFGSKSTMQRAFKKVAGMTPLEYKKTNGTTINSK